MFLSAHLFQEAASHCYIRRQCIIEWIVQSQKFAQFRAQPCLSFSPQKPFVILLLRLVGPAEKSVHCAAVPMSSVRGSAMPGMRIADHDGPSFSSYQDLRRVCSKTVRHLFLWALPPLV